MTIAQALEHLQTSLEAAGIDSSKSEAAQLVGQVLELSPTELILVGGQQLSEQQQTILWQWLARRVKREPLQHILGTAYFYGLELKVNSGVLIPRPETERLVELALMAIKNISQPKIIDIGTGSGAVALAIKHERPDADVMATDISQGALELAAKNAKRLGLDVSFVHSDLLEDDDVQCFVREADVLVSNPPYLPTSDLAQVSLEVQADPVTALYSGEDGLTHFRRLAGEAFPLLRVDAVMLLELDPRNVRQAWRESEHWAERHVLQDLLERDRFLSLRR